MNKQTTSTAQRPKSIFFKGLSMLAIALLTSCASVPVNQQGLLAKDSMQIADGGSGSSMFTSSASAVLEPGIGDGGSVATSCSSCR